VDRTFEFRLQPLLDQRRHAEHERRRDFAACRHDLERCDLEFALLEAARRRATAAPDLRLRDAYLRHLDAEAAAVSRRRAALEAACGAARDAVHAARRATGVIEKLEQRRRQAFLAEEARKDELELDEGNARRHERAAAERLARAAAEPCAT
jgi:flagellar export protein FliJ